VEARLRTMSAEEAVRPQEKKEWAAAAAQQQMTAWEEAPWLPKRSVAEAALTSREVEEPYSVAEEAELSHSWPQAELRDQATFVVSSHWPARQPSSIGSQKRPDRNRLDHSLSGESPARQPAGCKVTSKRASKALPREFARKFRCRLESFRNPHVKAGGVLVAPKFRPRKATREAEDWRGKFLHPDQSK
jgi:hypothetical protein